MLALLAPLRSALLAASLVAPVALGGVLLGASGCATSDGMIDKLYDSTRVYNRSLRWGDWDRAAEYLPGASTNAFIDAHRAHEDRLVVLDYRMTRLEIDKSNGVAASQVEIDWHTDDHLVVRTTVVDHVWQWYEGRWVLVDERRSGGKPLAIFAELGESDTHPYLPGLEAFREQYAIGMGPDEKRKRERERRKAEKARKSEHGAKVSLDELDNVPTHKRPASFN